MEPQRISLDRARREAKALLKAAREGDPQAGIQLRADRAPRLADAQRAVALRHGFRSWPDLVKAELDPGAALRRAARAGDDDAVHRLLSSGAPANARDPRTGRTPLHDAAAANQVDTVSVLVTWVPVDLGARDRRGRTALDLAPVGSAAAAVLSSCSQRPTRPLGSRHGRLADDAEVALLEHLATVPGVERRRVGDGYLFRTGLWDNSRNGVIASRLYDDTDLGSAIAALADVPARWYLAPAPEPGDLREALVDVGCQPERSAVVMVADLEALTIGEPHRRVREVADAADLDHLDDGEAELLAAAGPPLRHFVIPGVGGITTFRAGSTLVGMHLHVERANRRRGHATALVSHAVAVGRAQGCAHAVLAPTAATIPFFERLGFELERSRADHWYYLPH